jgi:hypothetical protein
VRDTIARQSDVDKSSMKYEVEPGTGKYRHGTITFAAMKGKSIDLQKIHEALRATRLGGKTNSGVNYLDIMAEGEVLAGDKETRLKVSGGDVQFLLGDDPKAKPKEGEKTPYQRLTDAVGKGKKIASVTGRLQAWSGRWPVVLEELAKEAEKKSDKKPTVLIVKDFEISGE